MDHLGIRRADVLGYSMGGIVAQQLAADVPERLRRLLLLATTPGRGAVQGDLKAMLNIMTPARYLSPQLYAKTIGSLVGGREARYEVGPGADPIAASASEALDDGGRPTTDAAVRKPHRIVVHPPRINNGPGQVSTPLTGVRVTHAPGGSMSCDHFRDRAPPGHYTVVYPPSTRMVSPVT
jgi:pimeloyl-ACP methyl ester carboxylesterase